MAFFMLRMCGPLLVVHDFEALVLPAHRIPWAQGCAGAAISDQYQFFINLFSKY